MTPAAPHPDATPDATPDNGAGQGNEPTPEATAAPPEPTAEATPEAASEAAAERRQRAERAVRGAFAGTLGLEGLMVLFVPRAIAQSGPGLTAARLTILLALVGLLWLAAGLQRRRFGPALGGLLQPAVIATGVLAGAMYVLGAIFGLIWIYLLRVRRDVLGR